jgi:hypothetical protein
MQRVDYPFLFVLFILFSAAFDGFSQNAEIIITKEPSFVDVENGRDLEEGKEPKEPFDVTAHIKSLISKDKNEVVLVFFCPELWRYELSDYEQKLDELMNSVLLRGGAGRARVCIMFFRNNSKRDGKGLKFKYDSTDEQADQQTCYVFNANEIYMSRLCDKYKRQFSSERVAKGCYKLELVDNDKCYEDIPHRVTAYARAVRELVDPDYSQDERNRMFNDNLVDQRDELIRLEKDFSKRINSVVDSLERVRKAMYAEIQEQDFAERDNLMSSLRFALVANYEIGGKLKPADGPTIQTEDNASLGYGFQIGQRIWENVWVDLGWSSAVQSLTVVADSSFKGTPSFDLNGTGYTQNQYFIGMKEKIRIRRNTLPVTFSYGITLKDLPLDFEAFVGGGISFVSGITSQITDGQVSTRASYDGFSTEIANIPSLGLNDDRPIQSSIRFHQGKKTFCFTSGVRARYKVMNGTSLFGSVGYTFSGNLVDNNDEQVEYSLLQDISILRQNAFNFSLGFSHCFKYEKK